MDQRMQGEQVLAIAVDTKRASIRLCYITKIQTERFLFPDVEDTNNRDSTLCILLYGFKQTGLTQLDIDQNIEFINRSRNSHYN